MIITAPHTFEQYGLHTEQAIFEVEEVIYKKDKVFYDPDAAKGEDPHKNAMARFKVYVNPEAYSSGKQPLDNVSKFFNVQEESSLPMFEIAAQLAFNL
jgi:hypothetical protein